MLKQELCFNQKLWWQTELTISSNGLTTANQLRWAIENYNDIRNTVIDAIDVIVKNKVKVIVINLGVRVQINV